MLHILWVITVQYRDRLSHVVGQDDMCACDLRWFIVENIGRLAPEQQLRQWPENARKIYNLALARASLDVLIPPNLMGLQT